LLWTSSASCDSTVSEALLRSPLLAVAVVVAEHMTDRGTWTDRRQLSDKGTTTPGSPPAPEYTHQSQNCPRVEPLILSDCYRDFIESVASCWDNSHDRACVFGCWHVSPSIPLLCPHPSRIKRIKNFVSFGHLKTPPFSGRPAIDRRTTKNEKSSTPTDNQIFAVPGQSIFSLCRHHPNDSCMLTSAGQPAPGMQRMLVEKLESRNYYAKSV